ncbi:hypothetical protein TNCV_820051 [Trichonephila clavipes]|nr:hypothetical protein TNCV_820051 [Trichonephila clavipes]
MAFFHIDNGLFSINPCDVLIHPQIKLKLQKKQSIKDERSAARDILTPSKQHVSPSLFRLRQRVSPWWPTCTYRTIHYQHSGGWQRPGSDLYHRGPLQPHHDLQRQPSQQGRVLSPGLRKQRPHRESLNGYVNKQNCHIWSEANAQVYVETPSHPEKLTVWCALWAGGILLQKR